ncbi:V-set and transmembrane domain-containing protein 1 isoform X2 [Marmota monax]|uniref:V-set and transmembrane domain-containing protein 1 isoform X2 n=1 Tax=Marmota monax TaxID=9995 RepID=UPI0026EA39C9|nr:V-set and transmembrane domain-containing protein 1 isoform X2 [Marmota monax]
MSAESLWLLCLGLCLGLADQGENEKLPRPSLCAWPSSVVELGSSVTLQCRAGFQNATFMLGKLHDPGFKQEQSSAETKAEFPLASLQPEDAGGYFCAYKTAATGQWSEQSQRLQLVVTGSWPAPSLSVSADPEAAPGHRTLRCLTPNNGSECLITALLRTGTPDPVQVKEGRENQTDFTLRESSEDRGSYSCVYYQCDWPHLGSSRSSRLEMQATDETDGPGAPSTKTDLRSILAATFSCLAIVLLLICVFLVDGWTRQDASGGDSSKSSHSKCDKQETSDFAHLENSPVPKAWGTQQDRRRQVRQGLCPGSASQPHRTHGWSAEVTHVELNADIPSEVASVPAEVPPASREGAELEV